MSKTTIPIAKPDDVSGGKVAQPYTVADLELGRKLVRQLHGVGSGFDAWAEHLAKAIAAERTAASERIRVLEGALKPFAACVYNDNGAVTFDKSSITNDDYWRAYRAHRAALHAEPDRSGG